TLTATSGRPPSDPVPSTHLYSQVLGTDPKGMPVGVPPASESVSAKGDCDVKVKMGESKFGAPLGPPYAAEFVQVEEVDARPGTDYGPGWRWQSRSTEGQHKGKLVSRTTSREERERSEFEAFREWSMLSAQQKTQVAACIRWGKESSPYWICQLVA